jgi:hypothetical protein
MMVRQGKQKRNVERRKPKQNIADYLDTHGAI